MKISQKNRIFAVDGRPWFAILTTRQTRNSSNQESVLVHLGLQIGLNFVPASKTDTRLRPAAAGLRQAVIFAGRRD